MKPRGRMYQAARGNPEGIELRNLFQHRRGQPSILGGRRHYIKRKRQVKCSSAGVRVRGKVQNGQLGNLGDPIQKKKR